jgi:DcmR-like sensory protein
MIPRQPFVRFYADEMFLTEAVASYIKMGLQVNDTLIVMVPASLRTDLRKLLTPDEFANTHLRFFDTTSLLSNTMGDDWSNQSKFITVLGSRIQRACQTVRGRVFGEMVGVLWAQGKYRSAFRLEELWNTLATTLPSSRLPAYPHSAFTSGEDPQSLLAVPQMHPHVHRQETGTSPSRNRYIVAAVVSLPSSLYNRNPRLLLCFARVAQHRFVPHGQG